MTPFPYKLRHKSVAIKRIPIPNTTPGGIYLPLMAIELPQIGHVVAIGPLNPDGVLVGDMVIFKKFEGHRLWLEDEEFLLLFIEDLIAVIKE